MVSLSSNPSTLLPLHSRGTGGIDHLCLFIDSMVYYTLSVRTFKENTDIGQIILVTGWAHHRLPWNESIKLRPRGTTVCNFFVIHSNSADICSLAHDPMTFLRQLTMYYYTCDVRFLIGWLDQYICIVLDTYTARSNMMSIYNPCHASMCRASLQLSFLLNW